MIHEPITDDESNEWRDEDHDEVIQAADVSQERHAVIRDAFLLRRGRLQPHLDSQHGLLRVDVLLSVAVPVFPRHHVFMLHSRQRIGQLDWVRLEDLIVGVLDLDVLLLDDGFHALVILEVQALVCHGLKECDELIRAFFLVLLDEATRGVDYD